jgi:hypothetical protein
VIVKHVTVKFTYNTAATQMLSQKEKVVYRIRVAVGNRPGTTLRKASDLYVP